MDMDSNGKKSKLPAIITAVGVSLVVLLCLFALPFKKETKKGDLTIITKGPLIPWYQDKEIHQELEVEEPSNAPIVGSWDFPKEIVETIHYRFGKIVSHECYAIHQSGAEHDMTEESPHFAEEAY